MKTIGEWTVKTIVLISVVGIVYWVCHLIAVTDYWTGYFVGVIGLSALLIIEKIIEDE